MAQVALLQTEMNSGFKLSPSIGIMSRMAGLTCWKQAFVKSPSNAKELCFTSSPASLDAEIKIELLEFNWIGFASLKNIKH